MYITKDEARILMGYDAAFIHSVLYRDIFNMQIVLRAHGYKYSPEQAEIAIKLAQ